VTQDVRDAWRELRAHYPDDPAAGTYLRAGDALCEALGVAQKLEHLLRVEVAAVRDANDKLAEELKTARRMIHEFQVDNTRLVEERRAAVAELDKLMDEDAEEEVKRMSIDEVKEGTRLASDLLDQCIDKFLSPAEKEELDHEVALMKALRPPTIRDQVEEFHRAMGVPVLERPAVPPDERVRLRLRLVAEEFFELLRAALVERELPAENEDEDKEHHQDCVLECAAGIVLTAIADDDLRVDLPEFADALADLDYVIEGARLEFGIDGAPVAAGVHAANLAKVGGGKRADGKVQKPEGWQPFDVAAELRRQGWRGP
jgi:predicted HAD superfamily Cof-like phosphohydrolase